MGIFKNLFGTGRGELGGNDDWLALDRRADYLTIGELRKNLTLELSSESCITLDGNTWFVARYRESLPSNKGTISYFVGLIEKGFPEVVVMVDRIERADGKTIQKDRWLPHEQLYSEDGAVIERLKGAAQNFARLWAYSSPPPYVMAVLSRVKA